MYYWIIETPTSIVGIKADTFGEACAKLNLDFRKCKVRSVENA